MKWLFLVLGGTLLSAFVHRWVAIRFCSLFFSHCVIQWDPSFFLISLIQDVNFWYTEYFLQTNMCLWGTNKKCHVKHSKASINDMYPIDILGDISLVHVLLSSIEINTEHSEVAFSVHVREAAQEKHQRAAVSKWKKCSEKENWCVYSQHKNVSARFLVVLVRTFKMLSHLTCLVHFKVILVCLPSSCDIFWMNSGVKEKSPTIILAEYTPARSFLLVWRRGLPPRASAPYPLSLVSCEGESPWLRLVFLAHPTDAQLDWNLGNLEAKATAWTLCQVRQTIAEQSQNTTAMKGCTK